MSSLRRAGCLAARAALGVSSRARTAWEPAVATTLAPRARAWGMGGVSRGFADDSHDDFKPKVHASGSEEIAEVIAKDIADNRVVLFMKGSADAPQCGFSNMACRILDHHGAEYATRNVLASDELRQGIKEFSQWPTIPQLFIDGEFLGGSDIMMQMHQSGELGDALKGSK